MNYVLLNARMHSGAGYKVLGTDHGPKRPSVRVTYSSVDGKNVDRTDLSICFLSREGQRDAAFMREIRIDGLLQPERILAVAEELSKVPDKDAEQGRIPDDIRKKIHELINSEVADPIDVPDRLEDFYAAMGEALKEKKGSVYCPTFSEPERFIRAALEHISPSEWLWNDNEQRYQLSVLIDKGNPDEPIDAEDTCTLMFTKSSCNTVGPSWVFDKTMHLVYGNLPEPKLEPKPAYAPSKQYRSRQAPPRARENRRKPSGLGGWVVTIILIAIATAGFALVSSAAVVGKVIFISVSLGSAKPILFLIYGICVGFLLGRRKN